MKPVALLLLSGMGVGAALACTLPWAAPVNGSVIGAAASTAGQLERRKCNGVAAGVAAGVEDGVGAVPLGAEVGVGAGQAGVAGGWGWRDRV